MRWALISSLDVPALPRNRLRIRAGLRGIRLVNVLYISVVCARTLLP
jgi:hypothetical protein